MAPVAFEVRWGLTQAQAFMQPADRRIGDVVECLVQDLHLPKQDTLGRPIVYGLYQHAAGTFAALQRHLTLLEARVHRGEELFLADVRTPWMNLAPKMEASGARKAQQAICTMELAPGHAVPVPTSPLPINRSFLLNQLPDTIVMAERERFARGDGSRLVAVSRSEHVSLLRHGIGWALLARSPIYQQGRTMPCHTPIPLTQPRTPIVIGYDGWPITIHLA